MTAPLPPTGPSWRYQLRVEIPATEAAILKDALAGEPFGLRARLGAEELDRQIAALELHVDAVSAERWQDFEKDLEILSVYLTEYVVGREIHVQLEAASPRVEAWKIIARRGQTVRLSLLVDWDGGRIVDRGEDLDDVKRRWASFPEWVRGALRANHPKLSGL